MGHDFEAELQEFGTGPPAMDERKTAEALAALGLAPLPPDSINDTPLVASPAATAPISVSSPSRILGGRDGVPMILTRNPHHSNQMASIDHDSEAQKLSESMATAALEDFDHETVEEEKKESSLPEETPQPPPPTKPSEGDKPEKATK